VLLCPSYGLWWICTEGAPVESGGQDGLVGAISLIFPTYNTVVLRPLPFPDPGEFVWA
jgi:hypothetical protein